eukprot:5924284-Prymnesium_polylepis.1
MTAGPRPGRTRSSAAAAPRSAERSPAAPAAAASCRPRAAPSESSAFWVVQLDLLAVSEPSLGVT